MRTHRAILREITKRGLDPKVAYVAVSGQLVPKLQQDQVSQMPQVQQDAVVSQKEDLLETQSNTSNAVELKSSFSENEDLATQLEVNQQIFQEPKPIKKKMPPRKKKKSEVVIG